MLVLFEVIHPPGERLQLLGGPPGGFLPTRGEVVLEITPKLVIIGAVVAADAIDQVFMDCAPVDSAKKSPRGHRLGQVFRPRITGRI